MSDNIKKADHIATGMSTWGYIKNIFTSSSGNKRKTK